MIDDEDERGRAHDEALVSLSIEPTGLSLTEIEALLGPSAPRRSGRPRRNWIAEFGRPVTGSGLAVPADVTLNAGLARLEAFVDARAEPLSVVASGADILVMITWTVHVGAAPVTMSRGLIRALGALGATIWMDGYGDSEESS